MKKTLILLPFLLLMGCSEKEPEDFNTRLRNLNEKIRTVECALEKAEGKTLQAGKIDLEVARFFSEYLAWEMEHPDIMKDVLVRDRFTGNRKLTPLQKEQRYLDHIDRELSGSDYILDQAMTRLKKKDVGPLPASIDWSKVEYKDNNFRYNGRIVFPAGFNIINWCLVDREKHPEWTDQDEEKAQRRLFKMKEIGGGLTGVGIHPLECITPSGDVDMDKIDEKINEIRKYEREGFDVFVGLRFGANEMLEKKWPGISNASGNGVGVDIDHPAIPGLIRKVMSELVPALEKNTTVQSFDMANEPFFQLDAWSGHSIKAYRKWLEERHGSIKELNRLWRTDYRNFSEIPYPKNKPRNKCSAGEWYDRISFHNYRVTSFFSVIYSEIHRYMPDAAVHMKGQDNNSLGPKTLSITDGINREMLGSCVDLHGLDTRPLPITEPRMAMLEAEVPVMNYDDSLYGFHWLGQSFLYDFLTSLQPHHPLIDLEYHAFSINPIRVPDIGTGHAEVTLWLAHLHGLIGNIVWYWHSRYGPDAFPKDYLKIWLYGSISTQPIVTAEYFHTMMDLNTFSEEITQLSRPDKKPIRLFVSKTSYIQNQRHIAALHRAYEGLCFHDVPVGCVTEEELCNTGVPSDTRMIVIPDAEYVSAEALAALEKAQKAGVELYRFGQKTIKMDEYGLRHPEALTEFMRAVPVIDYCDAPELHLRFSHLLKPYSRQIPVSVKDENGNDAFGVERRYTEYDGRAVIILINVSPGEVKVSLHDTDGKPVDGFDLLKREKIKGSKVTLPLKGVRLIELQK